MIEAVDLLLGGRRLVVRTEAQDEGCPGCGVISTRVHAWSSQRVKDNWVSFPLGLSPGVHEVTAKADSGATLRETFRVPDNKTRYAVIDYGGEDDSAELTWLFQRQPMALG